ncbi:MAG: MarR family winged helix-turn-helix transcriptional regulator [Xanthobacteraceae bacterium]|nr:MarR family winged helix-turn-helix transcriptional regulator [Xanthobacteraceae bacterium]
MAKRLQDPGKTLVRDARTAMAACACWSSRLAARRITNFLEERMAGSGLGIIQFGLMAQIAAAPDDTLGALAERTGLDQSTLSRNLRALELAGLVEIAIAEADQRRRAVWLTEEGARRLQAAIPAWQDAHGELARRMDPQLALRLGAATEQLAGK